MSLSYSLDRKFNLLSLANDAKMSPKRRTLLSLVFAWICLSKSLLIRMVQTAKIPTAILDRIATIPDTEN